MKLIIDRTYQPDSTIGLLQYSFFRAHTLELPDLDNQEDTSCIPEGLYSCRKHLSPANGRCIEIISVKDRTNVQIHKANYLSNILGCIAIGDSARFRENGEPWVTNSVKTLAALMELLPDTFDLVIR